MSKISIRKSVPPIMTDYHVPAVYEYGVALDKLLLYLEQPKFWLAWIAQDPELLFSIKLMSNVVDSARCDRPPGRRRRTSWRKVAPSAERCPHNNEASRGLEAGHTTSVNLSEVEHDRHGPQPLRAC